MKAPIIVKMAISEQAVLHAIESRMKDIYSTEDGIDRGRKAFKTQHQLFDMGYDKNSNGSKGLGRVLGREMAARVMDIPEDVLRDSYRFRTKIHEEAVKALEDKNYGAAADHLSQLRRYGKSLPREAIEKHLEGNRRNAILEQRKLRKYYADTAGSLTSRKGTVRSYMKHIDPAYRGEGNPNVIMQAIKAHPYRSAAIGVGALGLTGAGIYAATRKKDAPVEKAAGTFKTLKTVGKIGVPVAVLGGSALYVNGRIKKKPNYLGNAYKYENPIQPTV